MPTDPASAARRCLNCGELVEPTDDGTWWHIDGYEGYRQCRLFAEPRRAEA